MTHKQVAQKILAYIKKEGRLDWVYEQEIIRLIGEDNIEVMHQTLDALEKQGKIEICRNGFVKFFRLSGSKKTYFMRRVNGFVTRGELTFEQLYERCVERGFDGSEQDFREEIVESLVSEGYIHLEGDIYKRGTKKKRRAR